MTTALLPKLAAVVSLDTSPSPSLRSLLRLSWVSLGTGIFFLVFVSFFVVFPIAFLFEVVLQGERQFSEVRDRIADSVPINVSLPFPHSFALAIPTLPNFALQLPREKATQMDCEMSQCEPVRDCASTVLGAAADDGSRRLGWD